MIRVLLADDEELVRRGIRALIELKNGIEVVGEACDGDEALKLIASASPDVVLLDARMPRRNGLEVLQALAQREAAPACLLLTTFDDRQLLLRAVEAGARGYLRKDVSLEELVRAIESLAGGRTHFRPALSESLLRGLRRPPDAPEAARPWSPGDPLTPRETDVLRLLAGGLSNREIAHALDIADGTVKVHVSRILAKLGVRDRVQATLKAIESGMI